MTLDDLQALCSRLSYKPNSHLSARRESWGDFVTIRVALSVPDVEQPEKLAPVTASYSLSLAELAHWTEDHAIRFIQTQWRRLELHEGDEFFRLDGRPVTDPHPEQRLSPPLRKAG